MSVCYQKVNRLHPLQLVQLIIIEGLSFSVNVLQQTVILMKDLQSKNYEKILVFKFITSIYFVIFMVIVALAIFPFLSKHGHYSFLQYSPLLHRFSLYCLIIFCDSLIVKFSQFLVTNLVLKTLLIVVEILKEIVPLLVVQLLVVCYQSHNKISLK